MCIYIYIYVCVLYIDLLLSSPAHKLLGSSFLLTVMPKSLSSCLLAIFEYNDRETDWRTERGRDRQTDTQSQTERDRDRQTDTQSQTERDSERRRGVRAQNKESAAVGGGGAPIPTLTQGNYTINRITPGSTFSCLGSHAAFSVCVCSVPSALYYYQYASPKMADIGI